MGFVVKNTTKCGVLDLLCPHSCRGCGRLGSVLCERCKKNLISKRRPICPICKQEFDAVALGPEAQKCPDCGSAGFMGLFVGGWREGALMKMVEEYKYQSVWVVGDVLVDILDVALPNHEGESWRGEEIVVVPLPTIGRHVRERGLDHTLRLAWKLAKRRGWKCEQLLVRAVDTVQVGAKAGEREEQARKAYAVRGKLDAKKVYVLLDDVWTTGASMRAAAEVMKAAGVERVVGLVVAAGRGRDSG